LFRKIPRKVRTGPTNQGSPFIPKTAKENRSESFAWSEFVPLCVFCFWGFEGYKDRSEEAEPVVDILKRAGRTLDVHYYQTKGTASSNARTRLMARGARWNGLTAT